VEMAEVDDDQARVGHGGRAVREDAVMRGYTGMPKRTTPLPCIRRLSTGGSAG
jgi:hypothetical protein